MNFHTQIIAKKNDLRNKFLNEFFYKNEFLPKKKICKKNLQTKIPKKENKILPTKECFEEKKLRKKEFAQIFFAPQKMLPKIFFKNNFCHTKILFFTGKEI